MRRALEVAVAASALALAAFVGRAWLSRRASRAGTPAPSASYPGADVEDPKAPAAAVRPPSARGVTSVQMIRMTPPKRRVRIDAGAPPPPQ